LGVWWLVPGRSRNGSSTLWILRRLVTHQLIRWLFEHQPTLKQSEGDPLLLPSKTYVHFKSRAEKIGSGVLGCSFQKQHLTQRFPVLVLQVFFGLKIFPAFPTIAPNVHSKVDPGALSQSTGHSWRVTARLLAWQWLEKIRVRQTPALPPQ
jgi:hypothetical protein